MLERFWSTSLLAGLAVLPAPGARAIAGSAAPIPIEVSVSAPGMGRPAFDAGFRDAISRDFLALEPRWRQRYFDVVDSIPNPYAFASAAPGRRPIRVEVEATGGEAAFFVLAGAARFPAIAPAVTAAPATVLPNRDRGTMLVPGLPRPNAYDPGPREARFRVTVRLPWGARRWWTPGTYRYGIRTRTGDEGAERRAGFALASLALESLLRESRALSYERQLALGPGTSRDVEVRGDDGPVPLEGFLEAVRGTRDWDGVFAILAILAAGSALVLLVRRSTSG